MNERFEIWMIYVGVVAVGYTIVWLAFIK